MYTVTIIWAMIASASFTLGVTHLLFLVAGPEQKKNDFFAAVSALTHTWFSFIELAMMQTDDPAVYASLVRWGTCATFCFLL